MLGGYTLLALFSIFLILINAVKTRDAIFANPMALPAAETFSLIGFHKVLAGSNFLLYFSNSLIVIVVSLLFVVLFVVLFSTMAAWALTEYVLAGLVFCDRHHDSDPPGYRVDTGTSGRV
jgi:raffinose/stachyose/melibiose transport system permease protein